MNKLINKMIRIIDATEIEREYVKRKFDSNAELIDIEVRNTFLITLSSLVIKCYYSQNQHRSRNTIINQGNTPKDCPQYSNNED